MSDTPENYNDKPLDGGEPRKPRKLSLLTFIISSVALVLATVMLTYTISSAIYKKELADVHRYYSVYVEKGQPFEVLSKFIEQYSFGNTNEEELMAAALKAYMAETGDKYAYYYTAEEYAEYKNSSVGKTEGIGISIVSDTAEIGSVTQGVIRIVYVVKDSPAYKAGLQKGDLIYKLDTDEGERTVEELTYSSAVNELAGKEGSLAKFTAYRPSADKEKHYEIERETVITDTVYYHIVDENLSPDKKVGIIKISEFDLNTPKQFRNAMSELIKKGCTHFVFDVRSNPGGDLKSIQAVLAGFLNEGDVTIRTKYKDKTEEVDRVKVEKLDGSYAECSVSEDDIGRYLNKGYSFAVLCNENTASAAELFVATFRDYSLGTIVGENTYGKGSMQRITSLAGYGLEGAVKLTVAKYYSGANEGMNDGYDGVGIAPTAGYEVSLPEEVASKNYHDITDAEDTQLIKALESFKK